MCRLLGGGTPPNFVQNVNSGLNMEAEQRNNRVVQRGFVPRVPAGASIEERQALRQRNNSQLFFISPKSFGVGTKPKHAIVAVTTGLCDQLTRDELEAVLAYEVTRIRSYDGRKMYKAEDEGIDAWGPDFNFPQGH